MLSLLLSHIIITGISFCAGFLFYEWLPAKRNLSDRFQPFIFYLLTGLISVTMLFQILVLFLPLNFFCQAAVVFALLFCLTLKRKAFGQFIDHLVTKLKSGSTLFYFSVCAFWLLLLLLNAGPTMMDDTESYHIQMVKWIKEFGTVPGLVHLHERFGFNSSWFISIAGFSPFSNTLNFYTSLNGVLSLWLSVYLIRLICGHHRGKYILAFAGLAVLALCTISWPLLRGNVSTSNYDFITLLIIFVLFIETIRQDTSTGVFSIFPEWIIWPAFLFTVRLSNFPMLVLALFALVILWRRKEKKMILLCMSISLLLVIPFFMRNIILSGYAFYPAMVFDWFPVDWKADRETTEELLRFIKYYNRVSTGILPLETTEAMNFPEWTKAWMRYMFHYDKLIFFPGIAGLILCAVFLRRLKTVLPLTIKIVLLAIGLQLIAWFLIAPDPRFVYGCLLCGVVMLFHVLISISEITIKRHWPQIGLFILSLAVLGFTLMKIVREKNVQFVLPTHLPRPPTRTVTVDHIRINIPEKILNNWNPRCYATELPCAYEIDPEVRARGPKISDGFKLVRKQ